MSNPKSCENNLKIVSNQKKPTKASSSKGYLLLIVIPQVIPIICHKITRKMDAP